MKIRHATTRDMPAIKRLIAAYPGQLLQDELPRASRFFVAIEHDAIVGCAALDVYSKRLAEIRSVVVHHDFQGRGIATALIEHCLADAKDKNIYEVMTITGAVHLFEKNGFSAFNNEKYALFTVLGH